MFKTVFNQILICQRLSETQKKKDKYDIFSEKELKEVGDSTKGAARFTETEVVGIAKKVHMQHKLPQ